MTSNVITRHYPREDTDDADDADVEEGGGNVVEQERQHVSYQVLPGGNLVIAPVTLGLSCILTLSPRPLIFLSDINTNPS